MQFYFVRILRRIFNYSFRSNNRFRARECSRAPSQIYKSISCTRALQSASSISRSVFRYANKLMSPSEPTPTTPPPFNHSRTRTNTIKYERTFRTHFGRAHSHALRISEPVPVGVRTIKCRKIFPIMLYECTQFYSTYMHGAPARNTHARTCAYYSRLSVQSETRLPRSKNASGQPGARFIETVRSLSSLLFTNI